jgi:hypothetical protein
LLHQVFDPFGVVETIEIFPRRSRIVSFIKYGLDHDVAQALQSLQGRNIYDGCSQLGIELLPVPIYTSGATNLAPGKQQAAAATKVLKQEEKVVEAQPSVNAVAAMAVGRCNISGGDAGKRSTEGATRTRVYADAVERRGGGKCSMRNGGRILSSGGVESLGNPHMSVSDVEGIVPSLAFDQDVERI